MWHYEDYYAAELSPSDIDQEICRSINDGDEMSGHPALVNCDECLAKLVHTLVIPPRMGMGATILHWTDRDPCTIIAVSDSGKSIRVQEDNYERTDKNGMSESQQYKYSPNPSGVIHTFTLRKNGRWIMKGDPSKGGTKLAIGWRRRYYDYSF